MELIIFLCGLFIGWDMYPAYHPKTQEVSESAVPEWTEEDESEFNAGIIDYADSEEYHKWDGAEESTESLKEIKKRVLKGNHAN